MTHSFDFTTNILSLNLTSLPIEQWSSALDKLQWYKIVTNSFKTPYEIAIEYFQLIAPSWNCPKNPTKYYEKHHITPLFAGGSDTPANLIIVTVADHIFLHWLRFQIYNQSGDEKAYLFRLSDTEERAALRIKMAVEANKLAKKGFYDPKVQSMLGKRGGSKGGFANTNAQFLARQNVGKQFGKQVGLGNQSEKTKNIINHPSIWEHKSGVVVVVEPQESFKKIIDILKTKVDQPMPNYATMHKLLKENYSGRIYGWKRIDKFTHSEDE